RSVSQDICSTNFRIIDTGIGISRDQQENIFANFTQADSSITRDFGGTGLGLAISNRLLQLMESKIYLESTPGKGSAFSFTLLLKKGTKIVETLEQEEEQSIFLGHNLDILLVEDNPANQQLAVILLKKEDNKVTVANNGLEAMTYLSTHKYDIIFMDMQMPVMDGLTATRQIRQIEQGLGEGLAEELTVISEQLKQQLTGGHVHIVAVTANAMQEDRQQCLAAGMDDYLSKPYKKSSLLKVLQKFDRTGKNLHPPHPEAAEPKKSEPVSWQSVRQHIIDQFELEAEDAEEVLAAYAESLSENTTNIQQLLQTGEGTDAGRQAHALKGGLLNLGLDKLARTALILEKELPKEIEHRHKKMAEKLAQAIEDLTAEAMDH
ncbi:MAG: response regulator, partial [Candidatus Electrothrix sp. AR3]|nr:response regulator [Candidatus Electrothrix sp. AR3]